MNGNLDEVALNVLLSEVDPLTAVAASTKDKSPKPHRGLGLVILFIVAVALGVLLKFAV